MAMSLISRARSGELRASLLELAEACPVDRCNPEDCPLFALRQMKLEQRLGWFETLDEDDLAYLATYHHVCLTTKLQPSLARAAGEAVTG